VDLPITNCLMKLRLDHAKAEPSRKAAWEKRLASTEEELKTRASFEYQKLIKEGVPEVEARTLASHNAVKYFEAEKKFDLYSLQVHQRAKKKVLAEVSSEEGLSALADSIEESSTGYLSIITSKVSDYIEEFRSKIPGGFDSFAGKRPDELRLMTKASFGDVAPEAYKIFAKRNEEVTKWLVGKLRSQGVNARFMDNWGASLHVDRTKLTGIKVETFVDDYMREIDPTKMLARDGSQLTEQEIRELVEDAYYNIMSGGNYKKSKNPETDNLKKRAGVVSSASYSRIFHFKNGDSFNTLHAKYGTGDVFDNQMQVWKSMARDIAVAEKLGNRYGDTIEALMTHVSANNAKQGKIFKDRFYRGVFKELTGNIDEVANPVIADTLGGIRNLATATYLPRAFISQISDIPMIIQHARYLGMPAKAVFKATFNHLLSLDKKTLRKVSTRLYHNIDYFTSSMRQLSKFGDIGSAGKFSAVTAAAADFTIRANGVNAITYVWSKSFHQEYMSFLASFKGTSFKDLPKEVQRSFGARGFTADDWAKINKHNVVTTEGVTHFDIDALLVSDSDVAAKFLGMVQREADISVSKISTQQRQLLHGDAGRGTLEGELRRSFSQFWAFPITALANQWTKMKTLEGVGTKATFAMDIIAMTTVASALGVQLKELSKGNSMYEWDDPILWSKAFMMSVASAPVAAPAVQAAVEGKSAPQIAAQFASPSVSLLSNFIEAVGDVGSLSATAGNVLGAAKSLNPTWYSKVFTDTLIDRGRQMIDPKYLKQKQARIKRLKKEGRYNLLD
jgi:hypothetical protein